MSNSTLATYTFTGHSKYNLRKNAQYNPTGLISKITIHHMAGNLSLDTMKSLITQKGRQMSCNYAIDSAGRIGLFVPEDKRSWCSSSPANDYLAVTIEVANDEIGGQWHVSDAAMAALVELCTDICRRNGIRQLEYTGDKTGNLTMHCWFAATACPGPYLKGQFPAIAAAVNARLGGSVEGIRVGDVVQFAGGPQYASADAKKAANSPAAGAATVTIIKAGAAHPYHIVNTGNGETKVYGWVDASAVQPIKVPDTPAGNTDGGNVPTDSTPAAVNPNDTADWDAAGNDFVVTASKGDRSELRGLCNKLQLPVKNAQ